MTENKLNLQKVNKEIYLYWCKIKKLVKRERLTKKFKGTFTRHGGKTKLKLIRKDSWRFPNGIRNNDIKTPKIGYKRDKDHRFRRVADGLLFLKVHRKEDLEKTRLVKPYLVFQVAKEVSAKKREEILEKAKELNLPLYIKKPMNIDLKNE